MPNFAVDFSASVLDDCKSGRRVDTRVAKWGRL